jgi:hypothetical protein
MDERGQASIEWLGAVALVALVLVAAGAVAGGEALGAAVVRQVHRALCVVSGGVCDLDRRPCVVAADATADEAHVNLGLWRLSRHELILHERRSDGTVLVTYLHDDGVGWDVGVGSDAWLSAAGRQWAAGTAARAALIVSLGGGETWAFPDGRAAERAMAYLSEGRTPIGAVPAQRITRSGIELEVGAQASRQGSNVRLRLDGRVVEGTVVDERDGRRTHVITRRAEAAGLVKLPSSAAEAKAVGEERLTVTTDARGQPLELTVVRTGELAGTLSLPEVAQPIAGALLGSMHGDRRWVVEQRLDLTEPANLRAAQGVLDTLDGPLAMTARAGDALRARLAEAGVTEVRTYDVVAEDSGIGGHVGRGLKFGGGVEDHVELATLADARVRGPDGKWRAKAECLDGLARSG